MEKKNLLISILFISLLILLVLVLFFGFTSYNMMALYGDQSRFLEAAELQNQNILNLKFWRDFQMAGLLISTTLIPVNLVLLIYLTAIKKQTATKAKFLHISGFSERREATRSG